MNWILEKVQSESNLEELLSKENDSELLFQLSLMRKNLIEWIPFDENHTVLEIGAGCGVVTDELSRRFVSVMALESDKLYMEVNQYLNKDKKNIEYVSSLMDLSNKNIHFDEVILIGIAEQSKKLGVSAKELLDQALSFLRPNGKLILALDNKYSLKYWAGMRMSAADSCFDTIKGLTDRMTIMEVRAALEKAGVSKIQCFYPNADYRIPTEIFSEKYPIKAGSITANTKDYENTKYQMFDEVMVSDELCRDGMYETFASSYLLVAQKNTSDTTLDDVLYTKYNSIRASRFKLRTSIREENGLRYVEKTPMCQEAEQHLQQMVNNRHLLEKAYKNVKLVACEKNSDELKFEFIKGKSILSLSEEKITSLDALVKQIQDAFAIMFDVNDDIRVPFCMTDSFEKMYPECAPKECVAAYAISNLDSIVSNFVRTEDGAVYCLDYEWVADFPVPQNYIKYRSLLYIYNENQALVSSVTDCDSLLKAFGIIESEIALYGKMEIAFQQYVHGKNLKYNYLSRYEKPTITLEELIRGGATEKIEEYEARLKDKDTHISILEKASEQKDELITSYAAELQRARINLQANFDCLEKKKYYRLKPWRRVCGKLKLAKTVRDFDSYLNVDCLEIKDEFCFEGWAWDERIDNRFVKRNVLLERLEGGKVVETKSYLANPVKRLDVSKSIPNRDDLDQIGFSCRIPKAELHSGEYAVSLVTIDSKNIERKHRVAWTITI